MLDPIDFQRIKELVPIPAVLERLGFRPSCYDPGGAHGPCPFCSDGRRESRRFRVWNDYWWCYACQFGGDVVELWRRWWRLKTGHAAINLCEAFNLEVPRKTPFRGPERGRCP